VYNSKERYNYKFSNSLTTPQLQMSPLDNEPFCSFVDAGSHIHEYPASQLVELTMTWKLNICLVKVHRRFHTYVAHLLKYESVKRAAKRIPKPKREEDSRK
jgi:hypothetical protein